MTTWHRVGDAAELRSGTPCAVRVDRYAIAPFHRSGRKNPRLASAPEDRA